jgi:transcriptional regulator NrdR family protein
MITQIRKRNGNLVQFDKDKISCAITKANHSVQDEVISQTSLKKLTDKIVDALPKNQVPTVMQRMWTLNGKMPTLMRTLLWAPC